jgi:hypothetical protein
MDIRPMPSVRDFDDVGVLCTFSHIIIIQAAAAESIAKLPPFGPIEGQKWFDQISSQ